MSKYQKGKIYKLVSNYTDEIYIGSTIQPLSKRLGGHKLDFERGNNLSSKKLMELGEVKIILIENFPCETKEELLKRERFYIESMKCLNKIIPTQNRKEWREKNKNHIKKTSSEYYIKNYDKISKYRKDNKEDKDLKMKLYYIKNKEKIKEKRSIKYVCICGVECRKCAKARHEKSKKHITYINSLN